MDGISPCEGCGKSLSDFLDACPSCGHTRSEPASRAPRVSARPGAHKGARATAAPAAVEEESEPPAAKDTRSRWRLQERPQEAAQHVRVVDVQIPFGSMVTLLVKVTIAAIPAMIILGMLTALVVGILGGLGR